MLTNAPMSASVPSARVDADNYSSGSLTIVWNGNDALDAKAYIEVSTDGVRWSIISLTLGDVGSVLLDTTNDYQDFAFTFQQNFPVSYLRVAYLAGSNTTGTIGVTFRGYIKAPGV